jgi:hypothetical protein
LNLNRKNTLGDNNIGEKRIKVSVNCIKSVLFNKTPPPKTDWVNSTNKKGAGTGPGAGADSENPVSNKSQWGLFDSGSNLNLSGSRSDFSHIQADPTVSITAIDGDVDGGAPVGYVGKFHKNDLNLKYGVFFPPLSEGQRI